MKLWGIVGAGEEELEMREMGGRLYPSIDECMKLSNN